MSIFKKVEGKLKGLTDWIANEGRDDRWFLELRYPLTTKRRQLNAEEVNFYISIANEYQTLTTLNERLSFKSKNIKHFEFECHVFGLKLENKLAFAFYFFPNVKIPEEITCFNLWFIEQSREYLRNERTHHNGLHFINVNDLFHQFNFQVKSVPIVEEFLISEMNRVRLLCNKYYPKMFDQKVEYKVRSSTLVLDRGMLNRSIWPDLILDPYVEYYIALKKYLSDYQKKQIQQKIIESISNLSSTKAQKVKPLKEDLSINQLFKYNQDKLDLFIMIMKLRGYLTEHGRWNNEIPPGALLPVISFLKKGIIKEVSNAMLWRIFEKEFGPIMSERHFRNPPDSYHLDELLEKDLNTLKN